MQVIKHGYAYDVDKDKPLRYLCRCQQCGCEMEFTCNDLLYVGMEYYLERTRAVFCLICPECNTAAYSTYGEMMIEYTKDGLLNANTDITTHKANCSGICGAGIAKQIKARYPLVYEKM